jgi:hypothetical protein
MDEKNGQRNIQQDNSTFGRIDFIVDSQHCRQSNRVHICLSFFSRSIRYYEYVINKHLLTNTCRICSKIKEHRTVAKNRT